MEKDKILNKIKKYKGCDSFVLGLQDKINNGEDISILQIKIFERFIKKESKQKKQLQKKETRTKEIKKILLKPIKISNNEIKKYFNNLFEYQIDGIKWLIEPKVSRWLLDEQGLGKTIQVIISSLILETKKNIIICPNFLKQNWVNEIKRFTNDVQILNSNDFVLKQFNIINFESVHKYSKQLVLEDIDITIIDESQFVKHLDSRRHLYSKLICDNSKRVWLLTGTAKDNKLFDLFGQLKILRHPLSENKLYFGQRYCNTNEDNPLDFSGANNLNELNKILFSTVALRRTKEVLKNIIPDKLPNKLIYYELDNFNQYNKLLKEYETKTSNENYLIGGVSHLTEINILKRFLALQKIKSNTEYINNILIENNKEKVIIFSNYTDVINQYHNEFKNISLIHNGQTLDKEFVLNEFKNNDNIKILIAQFQNSHAGLNLQFANHTFFNELPQTPGIELQAKDRTHRPGQLYLTNYYYPMFENTIDETIYLLFQEEHKISQNVIDGLDNDIQIDLYKKLHQKILQGLI